MTKPTKWHVRPAKTHISLGIRPVWSESSLCAQWVAKDPSFLHADSEDSDQTGRMPRLIWVFAGRTYYFVGFVMRRLILLNVIPIISTSDSIPWHIDCPCTYDTSIRSANCSMRHTKENKLTDVPKCVPAETRSLDLSYNNITYQTGQFQNFTVLKYLDLSLTNIFDHATIPSLDYHIYRSCI